MYEKHNQALLPMHKFVFRLGRNIVVGLIVIALALLMGMAGYHYFEKMPWVDAFLNASMILSGMGQITTLETTSGKIFAGFYALFSGLTFIAIIGFILTPIVHRFFHHFHISSK